MEYVIDLGRRERKRQAVHEALLEAAAWLFRERGVARTTVDDIAEAADVARQTVFNHFPYKEALALELGAEGIQEVAQRAHALLEAGTPALEVLQTAAAMALDKAIADGELAAVVARELLHSDAERAARAAQLLPLCEIFEAILLQAREEGSLRGDLSPRQVADGLSAMFQSLLLQVTSHEADRLRRNLSVCFDMMMNGIVNRRS